MGDTSEKSRSATMSTEACLAHIKCEKAASVPDQTVVSCAVAKLVIAANILNFSTVAKCLSWLGGHVPSPLEAIQPYSHCTECTG